MTWPEPRKVARMEIALLATPKWRPTNSSRPANETLPFVSPPPITRSAVRENSPSVYRFERGGSIDRLRARI